MWSSTHVPDNTVGNVCNNFLCAVQLAITLNKTTSTPPLDSYPDNKCTFGIGRREGSVNGMVWNISLYIGGKDTGRKS